MEKTHSWCVLQTLFGLLLVFLSEVVIRAGIWANKMSCPLLCISPRWDLNKQKLWIFFTTAPLRIAWNSPNRKWPANMRVLDGVEHVIDYQLVADRDSQKEHFFAPKTSPFEQFWAAFRSTCAVICIESWWVGSHIKLSYDLKQNVTEVRTQFDMAVNPLWFNINLKTTALACRNGWCVLVLECHFQKGLFFMNYFYKTAVSESWQMLRSERN